MTNKKQLNDDATYEALYVTKLQFTTQVADFSLSEFYVGPEVNGINEEIVGNAGAAKLPTTQAVYNYAAKKDGCLAQNFNANNLTVTSQLSAKSVNIGNKTNQTSSALNVNGDITFNGLTVNGITETILTDAAATLPTTKAVVEYVIANTTPKGGDEDTVFSAKQLIVGTATKTSSNYAVNIEDDSLYSTLYVKNTNDTEKARAAYFESNGNKPTLKCENIGTNGQAGWFESKSDKATLLIINTKPDGIALEIDKGSLKLNDTEINAISKDISADTNDITLPTSKAVSTFVHNNAVPIGSVTMFAGEINGGLKSNGWLLCAGASLKKSEYKDLYEAIGTAYGIKNNNEFYIPDCRGMFVRGVDPDAKVDEDATKRHQQNDGSNTGATVGSLQKDAFKEHNHKIRLWTGASGYEQKVRGAASKNSYNDSKKGPMTLNSGDSETETRPKNIALYYIIKYKHV